MKKTNTNDDKKTPLLQANASEDPMPQIFGGRREFTNRNQVNLRDVVPFGGRRVLDTLLIITATCRDDLMFDASLVRLFSIISTGIPQLEETGALGIRYYNYGQAGALLAGAIVLFPLMIGNLVSRHRDLARFQTEFSQMSSPTAALPRYPRSRAAYAGWFSVPFETIMFRISNLWLLAGRPNAVSNFPEFLGVIVGGTVWGVLATIGEYWTMRLVHSYIPNPQEDRHLSRAQYALIAFLRAENVASVAAYGVTAWETFVPAVFNDPSLTGIFFQVLTAGAFGVGALLFVIPMLVAAVNGGGLAEAGLAYAFLGWLQAVAMGAVSSFQITQLATVTAGVVLDLTRNMYFLNLTRDQAIGVTIAIVGQLILNAITMRAFYATVTATAQANLEFHNAEQRGAVVAPISAQITFDDEADLDIRSEPSVAIKQDAGAADPVDDNHSNNTNTATFVPVVFHNPTAITRVQGANDAQVSNIPVNRM